MLKWTLENRRGEVASATVAGQSTVYDYDFIGNFTSATVDGATTTYDANELNQYETVAEPDATLEPTYTPNGELASFGPWTYAYDALSRLVAVYSNDTLVVSNRYDHLGRRIQKIAADGTHTFLYDGWRPLVETVVRPDSTTDRIDYVWGKDISGTLDGAAGIGGLLYVKLNGGAIYVPFYDAYGNVMGYWDAEGNVVASYTYDAFGRTVTQNGTMADMFTMRYSTKYYEAEAGLYYYGKRYYSPAWRRWLTRDPIGEEGGANLYGFCGNCAVSNYDIDGRAYFAVRKLQFSPFELNEKNVLAGIGGFADRHNIQLLHEHLFFQDGKSPRDIGFADQGHLLGERLQSGYVQTLGGYDDCIMRIAVDRVSTPLYSLVGNPLLGFTNKYNCQNFCDDLRRKYEEIKEDKEIRRQCCREAK